MLMGIGYCNYTNLHVSVSGLTSKVRITTMMEGETLPTFVCELPISTTMRRGKVVPAQPSDAAVLEAALARPGTVIVRHTPAKKYPIASLAKA